MKSLFKTLRHSIPAKAGFGVIITAAVLLEIISASQYYYSRNQLESELEKNVLNELIIKTLRVKDILSLGESALLNHLWYAERFVSEPDSMYAVVERVVAMNANVVGASIAFEPNYYKDKGYLFEPYARREGDSICLQDISGEVHDYTASDFYTVCMKGDTLKWSDPYYDADGAQDYVTTYALPLRDNEGKPIGAMCLDLSLDWMGVIMNQRHHYPSSFNLFLSPDGKLIAGPNPDSVSTEKVDKIVAMINDSSVYREETSNKRTKMLSFDDEGDMAYVYYAYMKGNPHWQVAVVCYDDEVYGKLNQLRVFISILSLAGLLLLCYILWRTARTLIHLHEARLKNESIDSELRVAQNIQRDMIPKDNPPFPDRDDLDIHGQLVPAKEVGGDLFDFFIRDEKLFFCIGDVSGKGVPSALIMAVIHTQFRMASANESNPGRILQNINRIACEGNTFNIFVTFFIGVLDLPLGRLRYCNAGHDLPVLLPTGDGKPVEIPANAHLPIGVFPDTPYQMQEMDITPGSTLFLYTDGLTEARNIHRELLGRERVMQTLEDCIGLDAGQVIQKMTSVVGQYAEGAEQSDDLTMLAIRYTPSQDTDFLHDSISLLNDVSQVVPLNNFVKTVCERVGMDEKSSRNVRLAVEEAVVNVINYAYPLGSQGTISVEARSNGRSLKFVISDTGVAFDPTEASHTDTTLSAEERPIGGMGILLVREMMDSINYERVNSRNILTLIKHFCPLSENN